MSNMTQMQIIEKCSNTSKLGGELVTIYINLSSVMCQNDRWIFDFRLQLIIFIYGSKWAHNATTVMDSLTKTKLRIIIEIYVLSMT